MKLLAVSGEIDAPIAEIRLRTPLVELARQTGCTLMLRSFHDCTRADLAAADVLIVQRSDSRRALRLQEAMRGRGGVVIYDIDDLLTEVAPHVSLHRAALAALPWFHRCIAAADIVTVSTKRLGHELGLTAPIQVPNYAADIFDAPPQPTQSHVPVTLLFASSDHLATPFVYPAVRALRAMHPDIQVVVVGPPAAAFEAAGVFVRPQPVLPRAAFIEFARSLPNVLGVIPLEDTRFAACKSAIKWFDYAAAGIPTLCSDVSPYREVIENGRTAILVANDTAAWTIALQAAIADASLRQDLVKAAREVVRERHALAQTVSAWQFAIESALAQRAANPLPPLGWVRRLREAGATLVDPLAIGMRRINRKRRARRQRR